MKKRIIPIVISILLLGGIIYTSNISKVISTIATANIYIIFFILCIWFIALILRSTRWHLLLRKADIYVPFIQSVKIYIPGLFLSAITPGKIGDPMRNVLLKQTNNISISKSISSIIIERILDIISIVFISLFFIPLLFSKFSNFRVWFILAISIYLFFISLAIFLFSSNIRTKKFMHLFYFIFSFIHLVKKSKKKINNFASTLSQSFSKFQTTKFLLLMFLLSLVIWAMEGFVVYFAFLSLGFKTSFLIAITTMAVSTLIGVLSFLPSGIGSSELIFILIITHTTSLTITQVISVALISRISFLMYAILGPIILTSLKYRYKILS